MLCCSNSSRLIHPSSKLLCAGAGVWSLSEKRKKMPRPSMSKVPLYNYKGRPNFMVHQTRRDDLVDNYALKYPIYPRLPEFWRKQFETKPPVLNQNSVKGTKRPHHSGLWTKDSQGQPVKVDNVPIPVMYTEEVKEGLWGGEGIIMGFKHARGKKFKTYSPKTWKPAHFKKSFYSEILERDIETTVTSRTLDLIDEAYGFDHYILKTPEYELCSTLGGNLKREMLLRLLNNDTEMYKPDPQSREKIYERYKKYIIPKEQAEWVGLDLRQAMDKQWNLEKETGVHDSVPLLKIFTEKLKQNLQVQKERQEEKDKISRAGDVMSIFHAPRKVKL